MGLEDCICRAEEQAAHHLRGGRDQRVCATCAGSMYACKEELVKGDTSSTEVEPGSSWRQYIYIRTAARLPKSVKYRCPQAWQVTWKEKHKDQETSGKMVPGSVMLMDCLEVEGKKACPSYEVTQITVDVHFQTLLV